MFLLSIILAVVVANALGMLWYSDMMFARQWALLSGHEMSSEGKNKLSMRRIYFFNLLLTIITATVIAAMLRAGFWVGDLFGVWSAFALPIFAGEILWDGKPLKLFLIKAGYNLAALGLMASVITWLI